MVKAWSRFSAPRSRLARGAVLVWGSVADDPAQSIAGYEGDAPTAVWTPGIEAAPPGAARTGNAATSERR